MANDSSPTQLGLGIFVFSGLLTILFRLTNKEVFLYGILKYGLGVLAIWLILLVITGELVRNIWFFVLPAAALVGIALGTAAYDAIGLAP